MPGMPMAWPTKVEVKISEPPPRGEDQRAAAARQQGRDLMPGAQEGGRQVQVQRLAPALWRDLMRRLIGADGPGVVQGDVQPAEPFDRRLHQPHGQGLVADVARHGDGAPALGLDGGDQGQELGLAPGGDDHRRAFAREQAGGGGADAGAGSGDDGDLVDECRHDDLVHERGRLPFTPSGRGLARFGRRTRPCGETPFCDRHEHDLS